MARHESDDIDLALFSEDELGPDHSETNKMMDLRARVDALGPELQARLAETLIGMDLDEELSVWGGISSEAVGEIIREIFGKKIGELEQVAATTGGCFYCKKPVEDGPTVMVRQTMWTDQETRKKLRVREDVGAVAHGECVDRVSEGEDPGIAPMF